MPGDSPVGDPPAGDPAPRHAPVGDPPAGDPAPRELRGLVPFEVAAVLALAIAPLPDAVPVALPLLAIASASRWLRRRDWNQLMHIAPGVRRPAPRPGWRRWGSRSSQARRSSRR